MKTALAVDAGGMFLEIASALLLAFLGYAVYVLHWTRAEPGLGGPIDDFIAAEDEGELAQLSYCSTAHAPSLCAVCAARPSALRRF